MINITENLHHEIHRHVLTRPVGHWHKLETGNTLSPLTGSNRCDGGIMMMVEIITLVYLCIALYFMRDFKRGLRIHKATLSHLKWGFIPRFTVREPNGRFKANKVGIFYIATH